MKHLSLILIFLIGYSFGNYFPLNDIFFPKSSIRLTKDFILKAGITAQQRHFQGSVTEVPTEINFGDNHSSEQPHFELVR